MVLVLKAAFDCADTSFEFEMGQTLCADSSVVLQAAIVVFLACAVLGNVEAAFARKAAEVVVGFAVLDDTGVGVELKGRIALCAAMVRQLVFTS